MHANNSISKTIAIGIVKSITTLPWFQLARDSRKGLYSSLFLISMTTLPWFKRAKDSNKGKIKVTF